jgi:drug/metabolite transporter (DMT)-like permease
VEVVLAIISALLFALGTVLQQRAGTDSRSTGGASGVLLGLVGHPVWLAGIAADGLGFLAQAAALGIGRLAVVQPLLVVSVVFALPLGARFSGQPIRRGDVLAAGLVVIALAGFLIIANPAGGRSEAPLHGWIIAAIVCGAVCLPLSLASREGPAPRRAALLGTGAGILFALSAALTKAVVDELHAGILHVLSSWEPYALLGVGYVSMTLNQLALNTGSLAATIATSTAIDPITSVVLGLALFHETLHVSGPRIVGTLLTLGVALAGVLMLARAETRPASN